MNFLRKIYEGKNSNDELKFKSDSIFRHNLHFKFFHLFIYNFSRNYIKFSHFCHS